MESFARRRLKFSLRTLFAFPLLVSIYITLGSPTQRYGLRDVERFILARDSSRQPAYYHSPLVITVVERELSATLSDRVTMRTETRYYFWFFGYVLPFYSTVESVGSA